MAKKKRKINKRDLNAINQKLHQTNEWKKEVKAQVDKKFKEVQKNFLAEFNSHPITKEIEAGPNAKNISGTLMGVTSGSLFGFIGFERGSNPIGNLRELLSKYNIKVKHSNGKTSVSIDVPTKDQIYEATPLPWAPGRSWVRSIEVGLSGLGRYLPERTGGSRSGGGIQATRPVRGAKFKNTSYLSPMLTKYYEAIRRITG